MLICNGLENKRSLQWLNKRAFERISQVVVHTIFRNLRAPIPQGIADMQFPDCEGAYHSFKCTKVMS